MYFAGVSEVSEKVTVTTSSTGPWKVVPEPPSKCRSGVSSLPLGNTMSMPVRPADFVLLSNVGVNTSLLPES